MVDVRDLAVAHVLAYEKPEAGGQRYIIANKGNYDWQEVLPSLFSLRIQSIPLSSLTRVNANLYFLVC
jgi:hypothetical protein